MTKLYSLVTLKDIQREIIKGFIKYWDPSLNIYIHPTHGSKLWIQKSLGFVPGLEILVFVR